MGCLIKKYKYAASHTKKPQHNLEQIYTIITSLKISQKTLVKIHQVCFKTKL